MEEKCLKNRQQIRPQHSNIIDDNKAKVSFYGAVFMDSICVTCGDNDCIAASSQSPSEQVKSTNQNC